METESLNTTAQMRSFITNADFSKLATQDGSVADDEAAIGLTVSVGGFLYNFASMTFRPPSISWEVNSQAISDQISRVSFTVDGVLDRMYSFAAGAFTRAAPTLVIQLTPFLSLVNSAINSVAKILDVRLATTLQST
jgi:hypothetical protein